ncbi:hypothetical protein QJS10_CPB12g00746 [Acorus calamus]|uniref:Uncharacterized protein n=1 Tax=Acorus calamus TaxID=4465 RepID=A0AAV9DKS0_ACOCL|nr:hypothetical protein QJS10_CPB12g00746 [Acorus calamus]
MEVLIKELRKHHNQLQHELQRLKKLVQTVKGKDMVKKENKERDKEEEKEEDM